MQWNEETLISVERMAGAAFTIDEIADVLELEATDLHACMEDKRNLFYKAYRKGYLARQLEVRERIFKDAKHGSSPAQTLANKMLDDVMIKTLFK